MFVPCQYVEWTVVRACSGSKSEGHHSSSGSLEQSLVLQSTKTSILLTRTSDFKFIKRQVLVKLRFLVTYHKYRKLLKTDYKLPREYKYCTLQKHGKM